MSGEVYRLSVEPGVTPAYPVGTLVVFAYVHTCSKRVDHAGRPFHTVQPAVQLRGEVVDTLPGGAASAFLARVDTPLACAECYEVETHVCTDTFKARPVDAVTLLGEIPRAGS